MNNQNALTAAEIRRKYTTQIKSKKSVSDYLKVAGRILLFRLDYPTGSIITEALSIDETAALFRASVWLDGVQVAAGHARITSVGSDNVKGRYVEMAETNAIGRALGNLGYGTEEFTDDDNEYIADSPVESRPRRQSAPAAPPRPPKPPVDPRSPQGIATAWAKSCTDEGVSLEHILEALGVKRLGEFDWAAANAISLAEELLHSFLNTLSRANAKQTSQSQPAAAAQSGMDLPATTNGRHYEPALDAARN